MVVNKEIKLELIENLLEQVRIFKKSKKWSWMKLENKLISYLVQIREFNLNIHIDYIYKIQMEVIDFISKNKSN